jgi:hypothetical protein
MKTKLVVGGLLWLVAQACGDGHNFGNSGDRSNNEGGAGAGPDDSAGAGAGNDTTHGGAATEGGALGQAGSGAGTAPGQAGMAGDMGADGGTSSVSTGGASAGEGGAGTDGAQPLLGVLQDTLQYPIGLWVRKSKVYITEARASNTAFGGTNHLRIFDATAGTHTSSDITNAQAVVVASTGKIYLGAFSGSFPGNAGSITVVDPVTLVESPVVSLKIAVSDMYIDAQDNIFVIGPSDTAGAKSIYELPASGYTNPVELKTGLGRVFSLTVIAGKVYFTNISHQIQWFTGAGAPQDFAVAGTYGLTASSTTMFSCDISANTVSGVDLATGTVTTPVAGSLKEPTNSRYDASTKVLYFVESGTSAGEYKDGRLQAVIPP